MICTTCYKPIEKEEDRRKGYKCHKSCYAKTQAKYKARRKTMKDSNGLTEEQKETIREETCWQYEDAIYM